MRRAAGLALVAAAGLVAAVALVSHARDAEPRPIPPPSGGALGAVESVGNAWQAPAATKVAHAAVRGCSSGGGASSDFDGDGREDQAVVGRPGCGPRHELWVFLASGGRLRRALDRESLGGLWQEHGHACVPGCSAGATDLDGDGRDELTVTLARGASQYGFGVFRVGRKAIRRLRRTDGAQHMFQSGGSLCCVSYVVCRAVRGSDPRVVQVTTGHSGLATYWHEARYAFDGRSFHPLGEAEGWAPWSEGWPPIRPGRFCG
jgi:hypothetical protein